MNYLEVKQRLAALSPEAQEVPLLLAGSGMLEQTALFLRAQGAKRGLRLVVDLLPFGTLMQSLAMPAVPGRGEMLFLLPWDLVPELDWRVGTGPALAREETLRAEAAHRMEQLARRPGSRFVYLPAPVPPLLPDPGRNHALSAFLLDLVAGHNPLLLDPAHFSLAGYLASGNPLAGSLLGELTDELFTWWMDPPSGSIKGIVTDLDHTLWHGVVGEAGPEGVLAAPEGVGYRHFIYQSVLKRLKMQGVLIAVATRNDADLAKAPFQSADMPLKIEDLVTIQAGYGAKSALIRSLATTLNLGLDALVFVDDNPVELAEVQTALPMVTCLAFPGDEASLSPFLNRLARLTARRVLTAEDAQRTANYQRLLASLPPPEESGAALLAFLRGLKMVLTIREPLDGQWSRAHQLINKTNQFNLNGIRLSDEEIRAILEAGGVLWTATLEDRTGSHGEILACLVDASGRIRSLVLSCRVMQRRVEFAFLYHLTDLWNGPPLVLEFQPTERNAPLRLFLEDPAFHHGPPENLITLDVSTFRSAHAQDADLFTLRKWPREVLA
ncbi:MAG: HAD-IIIC family phosphatase [Magnetococcales bacterium]|nr:HAD-IIIC family phosphatase [Magnetococcales bacterium]